MRRGQLSKSRASCAPFQFRNWKVGPEIADPSGSGTGRSGSKLRTLPVPELEGQCNLHTNTHSVLEVWALEGFPTTAQEEKWELPSNCSGGGVGASQLEWDLRSGSFPRTAQEEEWELPNCCSGGGVEASQLLPGRKGGSFPTTAQDEEWELPAQEVPRRRGGSLPTTAQEEEWELPIHCSRGGAGASQLLPKRRSGSFPTMGAPQPLPKRKSGSFPTIAQEEE